MTRRLSITSSSNTRLKNLRRLNRRRRPERDGVFLIEGHRQLRSALEARAAVREVYTAPDLHLGPADRALVSLAERRGAAVFELSAAAFASISGSVRPDGLAALVERWSTGLNAEPLGPRPLLLVCESVERPGNLGTIVRTACAAGASALLVCDGRTDPFHPEAVRGSVGAIFHLPVAEAPTDVAIGWLKERMMRILVATPHATRPYWTGTYTGSIAIVLGSERYGVTERWLKAADETVRIPMAGAADSLNVAVAAGVVLFEAARLRRNLRGQTP